MENYWFAFSLLTAIAIGLVGFINKVLVEEKLNRGNSLLFFYLFSSIFYLGLSLYFGGLSASPLVILFGVFWGVCDYIYFKSRSVCLDNLSSSMFFVNVRIFSSIALLFIGVLFFGDGLEFNDYIGFGLGLLTFFLLYENESNDKKDIKNGLFFLGFATLLVIITHFAFKYIIDSVSSIFTYFFIFSFTSLMITLFSNRNIIDLKCLSIKRTIHLNFWHAVLFGIYIYFLFLSYSFSDLGIAYKIQSYSIFIPIFLSMIFYKEAITKRKIVAFLITMVSLWFFI